MAEDKAETQQEIIDQSPEVRDPADDSDEVNDPSELVETYPAAFDAKIEEAENAIAKDLPRSS